MWENNTMTEKQLRQKYIDTLESWKGAKEQDGSFKPIIDLYNTQPAGGYKMTYHDPWCMATVTAAAIACNLTDIIYPECGCQRAVNLYKKNGRWKDKTYSPTTGDIIFYTWGTGQADHVGAVVSNDGKTITTIEGNKSDSVSERKITTAYKYIYGYGVPDYSSKIQPDTELTIPADHPEYTAEQFLDIIHSAVIQDMQTTGVLASLTSAQAFLESGRGNSTLTRVGNNLFGMKATSQWKGKTIDLPTTEYINGERKTVMAKWKVYDSWTASIHDHSALFQTYSRYHNLLGETDYKAACIKVQQDGYATSPTYADSLIKVIEKYHLDTWDKEVASGNMNSDCYTVNGYVLHNIKLGDKGSEVKLLQQMLIANGYGCGPDKDDGECGPSTMRAILLYQYDHGLGQAGKGTWEQLISSVK